MEHSPYERSISSGAYNFLRWLGAAFAPVMSGLIGNSLSAHLPYLVAGVLGAAALLFIGWSRTDLQTEQTEAPKA
jgi:MFS family permease